MSDSPIKHYTSLPSDDWSQAVGDLALYLKHTNGRVHTCYHAAVVEAIVKGVSEAPVWRALAGPFNANGHAYIPWGSLASLDSSWRIAEKLFQLQDSSCGSQDESCMLLSL